MNHEQIIQNLQAAREVLADAPIEQIDLFSFGYKRECGTLYCAAGWLASNSRFEHIMKLVWTYPNSAAIIPVGDKFQAGDVLMDFDWMDEHFGPDAFDVLFDRRGEGELDDKWINDPAVPAPDDKTGKIDFSSDRALALWRIDQQIQRVRALMAV